jgi:hypothetical protein
VECEPDKTFRISKRTCAYPGAPGVCEPAASLSVIFDMVR